jgi:hypothetical protein
MARLPELLGARTLGEIAADDDEIRLQTIEAGLDGFDESCVMGTEMEVGKMDDPGHARPTRHPKKAFRNSGTAAA